MYPKPYGSNAYTQASMNVSPMKAVIMLYEGVIRLVSEARRADEDQDYEARFNAISKASKIIIGLQGQLDFENGGEISPMLHQFYDDLFMRMMQMNSRNSGPIFDDVLESLTRMKQTWVLVDEKMGNGAGAKSSSKMTDGTVADDMKTGISSASLSI
ncbi:flagellar export chaperone FliS [Kiloniella majae]|uniref:flagellar export chaperone FliS n=1 Tax=Kiloniella majae TaxID=1938558 RepID=UPI000A2788F4|nr:flagellar export chaperone FliS [Kiloniella majae]